MIRESIVQSKVTKKLYVLMRFVLLKSYMYTGKVTKLTDSVDFPPIEKANRHFRAGPIAYLLAYGGDLSVPRMLHAFQVGVLPYFKPNEPYLWWTADERCVLNRGHLHIERTMIKLLKKSEFTLTSDRAFPEVVEKCRTMHDGYEWLNQDRIHAVHRLHEAGYVHSVEVWKNDILVGGLFGIQIEYYFYVESMFTLKKNASKYGFIGLALRLYELGFEFVDMGIWPTKYLESLGVGMIPRDEFLTRVQTAMNDSNVVLDWSVLFADWSLSDAFREYLEKKSHMEGK